MLTEVQELAAHFEILVDDILGCNVEEGPIPPVAAVWAVYSDVYIRALLKQFVKHAFVVADNGPAYRGVLIRIGSLFDPYSNNVRIPPFA